MLTEKQIEEVARSLTNGNRGQAEKLYLQDIILSTISRETVDELVFKGGTALLKLYQLDRFSEDLDFTKNGDINLEKLLEKITTDLEKYGAEVEEIDKEEKERSFKARLGIKGPLYSGERRSLSFIRIEINKKSNVKTTENSRYTPKFTDLSSFDITALKQEEIMAEKIRAIQTREKPRDLYDIYHLESKGVKTDIELIQSKLDYYDIDYNRPKIVERAKKLEKNWNSLSAFTYTELPKFEHAVQALNDALPEK